MTAPDKIILGTVQFGLPYGINNTSGQVTEQVAFKILDLAYASGVLNLDTAGAYGNAEEILGKYFAQHLGRGFKVITKFNFKGGHTCEQSLLESLKKLSLPKIDTILFHSYSDYNAHRVEIESLIDNYKKSNFERIGVSVYTNEEIEQVISDRNIEVVQAPFNILDNESKRGDVFRKLKKAGKQVHVRSVFLQGLFFKELDGYPQFLQPLAHAVRKLSTIAESENLSLADVAFLYPLTMSFIDGVLVGVDGVSHLETNLARLKKTIPQPVLDCINEINIANQDLLNPSKWKI